MKDKKLQMLKFNKESVFKTYRIFSYSNCWKLGHIIRWQRIRNSNSKTDYNCFNPAGSPASRDNKSLDIIDPYDWVSMMKSVEKEFVKWLLTKFYFFKNHDLRLRRSAWPRWLLNVELIYCSSELDSSLCHSLSTYMCKWHTLYHTSNLPPEQQSGFTKASYIEEQKPRHNAVYCWFSFDVDQRWTTSSEHHAH